MPIHPDLLSRINLMADAHGEDPDPEQQRRWKRFNDSFGPYVPPEVDVRDERVPVDGANRCIPVRIYVSRHARNDAPALVWSHGGAFVGGFIDMVEADGVAREMADRISGVVVSVDYRRAGNGVRAAECVADVHDAWLWTRAHARDLRVDPNRIAIGGASAGACLSAAATVTLMDDGGALPAMVQMIYPLVHLSLPPLQHEFIAKKDEMTAVGAMYPNPEAVQGCMRGYLGDDLNTANGRTVPSLAELHGFPRTLIINCEYDALQASGQAFAAKLVYSGVDVRVRTEPGVFHGHLGIVPLFEPVNHTLTDMALAISEL